VECRWERGGIRGLGVVPRAHVVGGRAVFRGGRRGRWLREHQGYAPRRIRRATERLDRRANGKTPLDGDVKEGRRARGVLLVGGGGGPIAGVRGGSRKGEKTGRGWMEVCKRIREGNGIEI